MECSRGGGLQRINLGMFQEGMQCAAPLQQLSQQSSCVHADQAVSLLLGPTVQLLLLMSTH